MSTDSKEREGEADVPSTVTTGQHHCGILVVLSTCDVDITTILGSELFWLGFRLWLYS